MKTDSHQAGYFRRLFLILLAIHLAGQAFFGGTARAGDAAGEDGNAVLIFSSFDGGGPEYSVTIDDPRIVACTARRDYGSDRHEYETGSSYQVCYTFSGLKPGSAQVTILASSPILDNYEMVYRADVDENLKVTLTAARSISRFELYLYSEMAPRYYSLYILQHEPYLSLEDDESYRKIAPEAVDALTRVFDAYDVASWDGFTRYSRDVLDGEGFRLDICLNDGSRVLATGDNAFPENYHEVIGRWEEILEKAYAGVPFSPGGSPWPEEDRMRMYINGAEVPVAWEENASVEALRALLPLTIPMSMYGGFEQVGPLGQSIVRDDRQTLTDAGDIVLYSGNQLVVFYGANSWAYTRLGHVNLSRTEMKELLGNGAVTITIQTEE